jgi:proteasome lid subunit RPN8/RPN11
MTKNEFDYSVEVRDREGQRLARFPAHINFEPAAEAAAFGAQRKAHPSVTTPGRFTTIIEPTPHATAGSPYCSGFRVKIEAAGAEIFARDFASSFFKPAAVAASSALVKKGVMKEGDRFNYLVAAYPQVAAANAVDAPPKPRITVKPVAVPLPLRDGRLGDFTNRSVPFGELLEEDAPVYIPQEVIEQANALTERAGDKETGGILVGHLVRDKAIPDIGVVVTAQIPVRHAHGKSTELTFTAKTWAAVADALALRDQGELMLGWWHSHPGRYWAATTCAKCPPERRRVCPISSDFFSQHDVTLHEQIYPKAYSLALVVTNTEEGLRQALYGWRDGVVQRRGFFIQRNPDRPLQVAEAVPTQENQDHEKTCT